MKTIPISQILAGLLLQGVVFAQGVSMDPLPDSKRVEVTSEHSSGDGKKSQGWRAADTDGDGVLSKAEFMAIDRIGQLPEEKREKLFARLDKDSNGSLDASELDRGRPHRAPPMRRLWELDVDRSGGISFEEFEKGEMFSKLPAEKREELFHKLDSDGDGQITPRDRPEPRPPSAAEILKVLDKDGDGLVSFEEFSQDPFLRRMINLQILRELGPDAGEVED